MDIQKYSQYLSGKEFSEGLNFVFSQEETKIPSRMKYIENIVKDKNIIHLGCADHVDLIDLKIKNNIWLHKRLSDSAKRCLGIDLNNEAINIMKEKFGYKDVICCDIQNDDVNNDILKNKWDYMVLGEVLEHIENPVLFLKELKKKYSKNILRLLISVPNAFRYRNFKNIYKNIECINTDHKFWFTPYTLAKIITVSGMSIDRIILCESYGVSRRYFINYLRLKKYPLFRDTIIAEVIL